MPEKMLKRAISANVICNNDTHKIVVTPRGHIQLLAHNLEAEKIMVALGGRPSRCYQIYDAWKKKRQNELPKGLRQACLRAIKKEEERRKTKNYVDFLSLPMESRLVKLSVEAVKEKLNACAYRRSKSRWAGGEHNVVVYIGEHPTISGESERVWSSNGKWSGTNSTFYVTIRPNWYLKVYMHGLAVIDGCLVLDVIKYQPDDIEVLAGKQGRGFSIVPKIARVITDGDCDKHLKWLERSLPSSIGGR